MSQSVLVAMLDRCSNLTSLDVSGCNNLTFLGRYIASRFFTAVILCLILCLTRAPVSFHRFWLWQAFDKPLLAAFAKLRPLIFASPD